MDGYDAGKSSDVLGPPPSYDSVVYGTDSGAASGVVTTGANIPPPPPGSAYPQPYNMYPPPPINDVNQPYTPYPSCYNQSQQGTAIVHPTTIVPANEQSRTVMGMSTRRMIKAIFCLILVPVIIFVIFLFIFKLR